MPVPTSSSCPDAATAADTNASPVLPSSNLHGSQDVHLTTQLQPADPLQLDQQIFQQQPSSTLDEAQLAMDDVTRNPSEPLPDTTGSPTAIPAIPSPPSVCLHADATATEPSQAHWLSLRHCTQPPAEVIDDFEIGKAYLLNFLLHWMPIVGPPRVQAPPNNAKLPMQSKRPQAAKQPLRRLPPPPSPPKRPTIPCVKQYFDFQHQLATTSLFPSSAPVGQPYYQHDDADCAAMVRAAMEIFLSIDWIATPSVTTYGYITQTDLTDIFKDPALNPANLRKGLPRKFYYLVNRARRDVTILLLLDAFRARHGHVVEYNILVPVPVSASSESSDPDTGVHAIASDVCPASCAAPSLHSTSDSEPSAPNLTTCTTSHHLQETDSGGGDAAVGGFESPPPEALEGLENW